MAKTYFPFDTGPGANVYELDWSKMARHWLPSGVIDNELNEFAVSTNDSGLDVQVASGRAWIMGHFFESDAAETLAIGPNGSGNPRIDRVVIRLDWTANTIDLAVVAGTPAASPTAPALTQSATVWEIPLAQVAVANGAVNILSANITDGRGFVTGLRDVAYGPAFLGSDGKIPTARLTEKLALGDLSDVASTAPASGNGLLWDGSGWAPGAAGALALISSVTLASDTANITFSNIPQTYRNLKVVYSLRSTVSSTLDNVLIRANGDSGANYNRLALLIQEGAPSWYSNAGVTSFLPSSLGIPAATAVANRFGSGYLEFPSYASAFHKTVVGQSVNIYSDTSTAFLAYVQNGVWRSTSAITSLSFAPQTGPNFLAGSTIQLYGVS
jgi:hypothetical protein